MHKCLCGWFSVNEDADLDMVQRAAVFACVGTAGQRCTTTRRIVSEHFSLFMLLFKVFCIAPWLSNITDFVIALSKCTVLIFLQFKIGEGACVYIVIMSVVKSCPENITAAATTFDFSLTSRVSHSCEEDYTG